MKKYVVITFLLVSLCSFASTIKVAVSVPPQAYLVEEICGTNDVKLVMITDGTQDPHTLSLSAKKISEVMSADVFFAIGMPFESTIIPKLKSKGVFVVVDDDEHHHDHEECDHHEHDPHSWSSPSELIEQSEHMLQTLCEIYPKYAEAFKENQKSLANKILNTKLEIEKLLSSKSCKDFVAFHPAWGFFAEEFGLNQVAVEHDGNMPSLKRIRQVVELMKEKKLNIILVQNEQEAKKANTLKRFIPNLQCEIINVLSPKPLEMLIETTQAIIK